MIHDNLVAGNPYEVIYADNIPSGSPVASLNVKFLANKYDTINIQLVGFCNANNGKRQIYYDLNTPHNWSACYDHGGLAANVEFEIGSGYEARTYALLAHCSFTGNFNFAINHTLYLNPGVVGYINSLGNYSIRSGEASYYAANCGNISTTKTPPVEPTRITIGVTGDGTSFYGGIKVIGERRILKGW